MARPARSRRASRVSRAARSWTPMRLSFWPWWRSDPISAWRRSPSAWPVSGPCRPVRRRCGISLSAAASASKKTAHAAEQERPDVALRRQAWFDAQPDLDPEKLIFIDETGASTKMARLRGRAKRGMRCRAAIPHGGVVTLTAIWPACGRRRRRLCNGRHLPPLSHRVAAELAECSAGDQMALDVEEVVDGRMDGEEPLRGRGRFEPLHLSLSSSHRLM